MAFFGSASTVTPSPPKPWHRRRRARALVVAVAAMGAAAGVGFLCVPTGHLRHHFADVSLMHGWLPLAVQTFAAVLVVGAVVRRSRRWSTLWLPISLAAGVALAVWAHWLIGSAGVAGDPAPGALWFWIGLSGSSAALVAVGWRRARWGRRAVSALAVPLCVLSASLTLNGWVGYFPTAHTLWTQLTEGPLANQTDRTTVTAMQLAGVVPAEGVVVPVTIDGHASGFKHRGELVYLPPAWFADNPPPRLPVVMMIGGEFNTPSDWVRAGDAVRAADAFAAAHDGNAPVLVFVDSGGAFNIDTECVNGPRGNAADHLTEDVMPFMINDFGVSPDRAHWGVAGFSAGGTCALDLAVMHPEQFSAFADIAGDLSPNSGTTAQTVDRLFGGSLDAWARFDPATVITRHGRYEGLSGSFTVVTGHGGAADTLCRLGRTNGIECAITTVSGRHDWPFAGRAFAQILPWLAGQLGTPAAPRMRVPGNAPGPPAPAGPAAAHTG